MAKRQVFFFNASAEIGYTCGRKHSTSTLHATQKLVCVAHD